MTKWLHSFKLPWSAETTQDVPMVDIWRSSSVLLCSICLADTETQPKAAVTIIRGYAVCVEHAELVGFAKEIEVKWKESIKDE